jgi:hypothetical protein
MVHVYRKWIFFENVYDTAPFCCYELTTRKHSWYTNNRSYPTKYRARPEVPKHTCYVKSTVYFKPSFWSNTGAVAAVAAFDQMDHKHKYLSNTLYIWKQKQSIFWQVYEGRFLKYPFRIIYHNGFLRLRHVPTHDAHAQTIYNLTRALPFRNAFPPTPAPDK